ncbi:hypothetical protein V6N11_000851 [Hibiscus sabdariffa]|uniref:DC1 domain-containing protein n=1 Tax=Hibiscus sabdariffa TaxID=183260 RepID=A0ABR2RXY6_9ROSI
MGSSGSFPLVVVSDHSKRLSQPNVILGSTFGSSQRGPNQDCAHGVCNNPVSSPMHGLPDVADSNPNTKLTNPVSSPVVTPVQSNGPFNGPVSDPMFGLPEAGPNDTLTSPVEVPSQRTGFSDGLFFNEGNQSNLSISGEGFDSLSTSSQHVAEEVRHRLGGGLAVKRNVGGCYFTHRYGCRECILLFHKYCVDELKPEVQCFFHPCPLVLFTSGGRCCPACEKYIFGIGYGCKLSCDFYVHVECALKAMAEYSDEEHSIPHFTHPHPLKPVDFNQQKDVSVTGVGVSIRIK